MSVATHGQSGFGLGFNAIVLHREGYQADLTRARVRGYARYIEPLGFQDEVSPTEVLSDYFGVAWF